MNIKIATISGTGTPVYRTAQVVNSGTLVIPCNDECDDPRLEHRYMGYSPAEATERWLEEHTN
jgi:hypothetical protein